MTAAAPRFAAAAPATAVEILSAMPGLGAKYRAVGTDLTGTVTVHYDGYHAVALGTTRGKFPTPREAEKAVIGALLAEIATAGAVTTAFPTAAPLAAAA